MVSPDMLGNTPGFSLGYFSFANGVKEGSFPVIDVAHNGDDRRA